MCCYGLAGKMTDSSKEWPLIYCNGDSYSDHNYHASLHDNTYAHVIGRHLHGHVINRARSGSCNRRIIRTTVHDLLLHSQLNPGQKIICLIGLTFEMRSEIWLEDRPRVTAEESNFHTHTFADRAGWKDQLVDGSFQSPANRYGLDQKYFDMYTHGRAYFYSPYAERINLLCDLIMLRALMDQLGVKFVVFQSPRPERLEQDYLLDRFLVEIQQDQRFLDLQEFSFTHWCDINSFQPLDAKEPRNIAHYGADAHKAFAERVLIPHLEDL